METLTSGKNMQKNYSY